MMFGFSIVWTNTFKKLMKRVAQQNDMIEDLTRRLRGEVKAANALLQELNEKNRKIVQLLDIVEDQKTVIAFHKKKNKELREMLNIRYKARAEVRR